MRTRTVVGSFIGTGVALTIAKVGFKPRALRLFNQDDPAFGEHIEGMADASVAKQVDGTSSFATTNGVTLTDTGFTIGTDTDLNVDSERTWFVAQQ
jgi:hypothetical protein